MLPGNTWVTIVQISGPNRPPGRDLRVLPSLGSRRGFKGALVAGEERRPRKPKPRRFQRGLVWSLSDRTRHPLRLRGLFPTGPTKAATPCLGRGPRRGTNWSGPGPIIARFRQNASRAVDPNSCPNHAPACSSRIMGVTWGFRGFASLIAFVLSANIHRRHMTKSQRAMAVATLSENMTTRKAGEVSRTNRDYISRARTVLHHAPDLADNVLSGSISLDAAYQTAKQRKDDASSEEAQLTAPRRTPSLTSPPYFEGKHGRRNDGGVGRYPNRPLVHLLSFRLRGRVVAGRPGDHPSCRQCDLRWQEAFA